MKIEENTFSYLDKMSRKSSRRKNEGTLLLPVPIQHLVEKKGSEKILGEEEY